MFCKFALVKRRFGGFDYGDKGDYSSRAIFVNIPMIQS